MNNKDNRFTISSITQLTDAGVTQTTDFLGDIRRTAVDVQSQQLEAGIRAKLIELGWTPPGAPVPAQGAEGVEALAEIVYEAMRFDREDAVPKWVPGGNSIAQDVARSTARRLRNSPESTGLLSLIADIRAAAGDPTGKLMQDELVVHIRALRKQAGRYRWLRDPSSPAYVEWIDCSHRNGIAGEALDDAIDAARSAGVDDEA